MAGLASDETARGANGGQPRECGGHDGVGYDDCCGSEFYLGGGKGHGGCTVSSERDAGPELLTPSTGCRRRASPLTANESAVLVATPHAGRVTSRIR
ncbi:hypothetical protein Ate02nite_61520 [Paractinoplanes tereljensis]|uniref:Uncharacterized protein n=1 Tax=Paractinoplanes tereljensis TaxID=571912 RepID=A0A919TX08_9ACTN|nr:hypothetical protein Ate02nite_61520 [Actinoplanes tereljensis]